jgi:hypothetical protein
LPFQKCNLCRYASGVNKLDISKSGGGIIGEHYRIDQKVHKQLEKEGVNFGT